MDWSNERYVRLYVRDTVTWKKWSWQARAVFGLLLRKVDRSGVLDTGRDDKADALALIIDVPTDVAAVVLDEWVNSGTVELKETAIYLPHFREAQEAAHSDKMRQAESRKRRALVTSGLPEDARHALSQPVTDGHSASQPVTPAVLCSAVPSCAVPAVVVTATAGKKPKKPKAQAELPEIVPPPPPKEPSRGEVLFELWEATREQALEDLGVEAHPDAPPEPAFINKIFRRWFELWPTAPAHPRIGELGLQSGAEWRCLALFEAYLELDWPAKCVARVDGKDTGTPQPYPFGALCAEKVWGELVAKLYPEEPYALAWPQRKAELRGERGAA